MPATSSLSLRDISIASTGIHYARCQIHPQAPRVGVVRESGAEERRVALVPRAVAPLVAKGIDVVVESGAGAEALTGDDLYLAAGATIGDAWRADIVLKVAPPTHAEIARLSARSTLIGFLAPRNTDKKISALQDAGVVGYAVEAIPRISRAQVMDALSSQANVAGYKSVLLAATLSTRFFPMLTTAAGTVKPASVLVLGVGVAGLQALATARRLGGRVTGYDVRPEGRRDWRQLRTHSARRDRRRQRRCDDRLPAQPSRDDARERE